mgnify:CR=1 FL=1
MRKILHLLLKIFLSIYNLINIYVVIFKNSKKKKIFFYFPNKDLTLKDLDYVRNLLQNIEKKYLVIFGHNINNLKYKNFFFLEQKFLPLVFGVDLFVSNYLCDNFTTSSKRIYIHHCIYDTPLTGKKNEKKTLNQMANYNFIFLSSNKIIESFKKYFKKINKKVEFVSTGYPRLDYLNKIKKVNNKKSIIIAPANFVGYPNFTIMYDILNIMKKINNNFKTNIIFRPHPANRKYFTNLNNNYYFRDLLKYINENKNITLDFSEIYINNYEKSYLMITDLSGTAYTFSFLTNNPVIFISKDENQFRKNYYFSNHFKDRKKIGHVIQNINNINNSIKNIKIKKKFYHKQINSLKKLRLDHVGSSQKKFEKTIYSIINK